MVFYTQLDECVDSVVRAVGRYAVVINVHSCFLQMSLQKRFSTIAPKPVDFSTVVMEKAVFPDDSRGVRPSNTYKPRRWPCKTSLEQVYPEGD